MLNKLIYTTFGLLLAIVPATAQTVQQTAPSSDNPELTRLFNEDQRVRVAKPLGPDEPKITRKDADRETLVKQMLAHDQVITKADDLHAAVILQHSHDASDILVAHTLAVLCAADRDKTCLFLTAATLDRYLQYIHQPQIFGTQYVHFDHPPVTQAPYADVVISDFLRSKFGLSSLEQQKKRLEEINSRSTSGQGTSLPASQAVPPPPKGPGNE